MTRNLNATFALAASAMAVSFAFFAAPAHATNGQEAIDACNARPNCLAMEDDDKGILINVGDSYIFCYDRQSECIVVVRETRPPVRPRDSLRADDVAGANPGSLSGNQPANGAFALRRSGFGSRTAPPAPRARPQ